MRTGLVLPCSGITKVYLIANGPDATGVGNNKQQERDDGMSLHTMHLLHVASRPGVLLHGSCWLGSRVTTTEDWGGRNTGGVMTMHYYLAHSVHPMHLDPIHTPYCRPGKRKPAWRPISLSSFLPLPPPSFLPPPIHKIEQYNTTTYILCTRSSNTTI